jgi:branched-chain amino acid transport system substrate-binding protein
MKTMLCACGAVLALSGCGGGTPSDGNAISIGLLLPFTGTASATSGNFERAVLYAAGRINDGGGVQGRRVRVVSQDTHSDLARSRGSADALVAAGAVVVIGPESAEVAQEIAPTLAAANVALLSPLVGAADDNAVDCTHPWYRLAPAARSLGEGLAKLVSSQSITSAAVLYEADAYDQALAQAAAARFTTLGGTVALSLELDPGAQSYASAVAAAIAAQADAIALAASPRTGALVVNEFEASASTAPRWFLSPLLKTELLLENVAPEALEGALGVAPKIYDTTPAFPDAFDRRWQGDHPLEGAYFYYDAMALLAFALQGTPPTSGGRIDLGSFETGIQNAAAPPGVAAGWDEIETGLGRMRNGDDMYYSGLTGPMLLSSCGQRQLGATTTWQVHGGQIIETQ